MTRPERLGRHEFALFAALYALQGAVAAYFLTFNPLYLATAGVPRQRAADIQSVALLPFILKFLAGPISDRFSLFGLGRRKPYIVLGLVLQTLGLGGLAVVEPGRGLGVFTALAVLAVTGMALYDTCCDGLAIDLTPPHDRDRVQGTLVAARALAAMGCSYGFGSWIEAGAPGGEPARYRMLLGLCATLGLLPLLQTFSIPEPAPRVGTERFQWSALRVLARPRALVLLGYGAVYALVAYGVEINLSPYYHALGIGTGTIGALGALRYVGRALGGVLLPLASRRLGRTSVLTVAVLALSLSTAAQAAVEGNGSAALAAVAFGAANGWADALFFVMAMEAADPRMAASTYALLMAVTNISVLGGSGFAHVDLWLGGRYRPTFLAAAGATLPLLLLVGALRGSRRSEKKNLGRE